MSTAQYIDQVFIFVSPSGKIKGADNSKPNGLNAINSIGNECVIGKMKQYIRNKVLVQRISF